MLCCCVLVSEVDGEERHAALSGRRTTSVAVRENGCTQWTQGEPGWQHWCAVV